MIRGGIIAAGWGERLGRKEPKALTRVGGKPMIDYVLEGFSEAGIRQITCIVNEAAGDVPRRIGRSQRPPEMDWIIQTTPSSMHSFFIVLERLSRFGDGPFLITTVDAVCEPQTYARFARQAPLFPEADVVLGLSDLVEDEKPLRVAMRGDQETGILPPRIEDNPEAFEIVAMTTTGFDSAYVTSGFYFARPSILKEKNAVLGNHFTALRQYLGHLLKYGYRLYGVPLPPVVDVDRPQDIESAERVLAEQSLSPWGRGEGEGYS